MNVTRISIVTETYAPEVNGVANTLGHLVNGLQAKGIQVQVVRPRQNANDDSGLRDGVESVTLPGLPIPGYSGLKFGLPSWFKVKRALKTFSPQAIYVATEGPLGVVASMVAKRLRVPVLSGFHTNFHQYFEHYHLGLLKGLAYQYLRAFHNRTSGTVVPTQAQRNELCEYGFERVSVMSRGVDSDLFDPRHRCDELRASWGVSPDQRVMLYVGRIAKEKNLDLVLSTHRALMAAGHDVALVLVGDGPQREVIEREHPEVICCGVQRGHDLAKHYASGDVFVFPSKTDTFGNVVTEAMASGLAVIGFDYAAAQEHIEHNVNGVLVPFGDANAFTQSTLHVFEHPDQCQQLRLRARDTAASIHWDHVVDTFVQRLSSSRQTAKEVSHYGKRKAA